jgi:hypothetical protein
MPRIAAGPHRFLIAGTVALAATSVSAASPHACKLQQAVYQSSTGAEYELEFSSDFVANKNSGKSGVLRYRAPTGLVEYDVYTTWTPGLARPYLLIPENRDPTDVLQDRAVSSVILRFNADFRPPRTDKRAPPYLVTPDLDIGFSYWHEEQRKYPEKIIPPVTWKLVRCRGASSSASTSPPPRSPSRR